MRPAALVVLIALWVCGMALRPALAEGIIASVSSERINIQSNFTGTEIVVFGEIQRDGATVSRAEAYDIVVIVSGPSQKVTTRRKDQFFGVWINRQSETFAEVPSFYALNSTRPIGEIANRAVLDKYQLGLHNLSLKIDEQSNAPLSERDDFRQAFLRLRLLNGLYSERSDAIVMLSKSLFRTNVRIPSNVPVGDYEVTTYLLRGGALLASQTEPLSVAKIDFEQATYRMAHQNSFLYGLIAVLLAVLTGWLAGVIFRKD